MVFLDKKKGMYSKLLLICSIFLISLPFMFAYENRINLTITETVYQNVSYGKDYNYSNQQEYCMVEAVINTTNPSSDTVFDIVLAFDNIDRLTTNFTYFSGRIGYLMNDSSNVSRILYIPELRAGEDSVFVYNMSCMGIDPPVEILTNYSNSDHPDINKKVLAGYNWTLNQTVINNNPLGNDITNLNINMMPQDVVWNDTNVFPFVFAGLYELGDNLNVNTADPSMWIWDVNGGTLPHGDNVSIKFNMTAPFSVPFTATFMALLENITYDVSYAMTNLTVEQINASADIEYSEEKRIFRPADNLNNSNVTWEVRPKVYSELNISYDLNKVELWVTNTDGNPNDIVSGLNVTHEGMPLKEINLTTNWGNSSYFWYFNYTDSTDPPVVWIRPEWLITNDYGQILNHTTTVSGEDLYMKYIYVVHGYWLEIEKNISNIGEGQYRINTTVKNIGNGWTPIYEAVTVYDFVPDEFTAWNFSDDTFNNQSVGIEGSNYYGDSYVWSIPWKGDMNSSLGPMKGPNATGAENYTWNVAYTVNGTGTYSVSELYIVGLDPLKVDGAHTSPLITIISGIKSKTNELIYIGIILFLILINVTNLFMTHRINKKISGKLPPPPSSHVYKHH
ncbi:MAG: hypothetical protein ACLFPJ_01750 [Candidatus Woesearchaeota archaeon]